MTVKEFLQESRDRISDHHHFCRGPEALDYHGHAVLVNDEHATRWCSMGSLHRTVFDNRNYLLAYETRNRAHYLLNVVARSLYNRPYIIVSDDFGHTAAMKVFDRAIEECYE